MQVWINIHRTAEKEDNTHVKNESSMIKAAYASLLQHLVGEPSLYSGCGQAVQAGKGGGEVLKGRGGVQEKHGRRERADEKERATITPMSVDSTRLVQPSA